jgi:asparagine synthase (glutamine-hydrolysing)
MCGIVAVLDPSGKPVAAALVDRMRDSLAHRGPDDSGTYVDGPIGLGHRRLSILDLSPAGHQPMGNEDGSVWLIFNGEIYSYVEQRERLRARGHRFRSDTDSEVILHLYEEQGIDCVDELRGMFAFVLWDAKQQRLLAACDRLGKKPLYHAMAGHTLLLGSEIKALLEHPEVQRRPERAALHRYLALQYVPTPSTAFVGVSRLPPGHRLVWERGVLKIDRYWRPRFVPKHSIREEAAVEELANLLQESVRIRLRSDVPLGLLLSGGLDSSLIAAIAAPLTPKLHTFSIGFPEQGYDETPYARTVAHHLGTEHHELEVRPDLVGILPRLVRHYDQPFADPAALPTFALCEMTRRHVTVALNGDGGDELFAGYARYQGADYWRAFQRLPRFARESGLWRQAAGALRGLGLRGPATRLENLQSWGGESLEDHYLRAMSRFSPEWLTELYSDDMRAALQGCDAFEAMRRAFRVAGEEGLGPIDTLLAVDCETYLPDCLLTKVDVASMAFGLEVRSPLLDHVLLEYVARLPEALKLHGKVSKYLLRRVAAPLLPPAILQRKKAGFGTPLASWFRGELRAHLRDLVLDGGLASGTWFRRATLERLVTEHQEGKRDHAAMLWSLLVLETWRREYLGGQSL